MSVNSILGPTSNSAAPIQANSKISTESFGASAFATLFAGLANTSRYTDDQLKKAFASTTSAVTFANQAAAMGLDESQIQNAMKLCGYGNSDLETCKSDIENWVANAGNGFTWGENGALTQVQSSSAQVQRASSQTSGGMTIAGHFFSTQQIKGFYAEGGNVNELMQRNGITNPWEIGGINSQARQLVGGAFTEEENRRSYFKEYQKYNPNGKYANDFAGFVADQDPFTKLNMGTGQYSGAVTALADFEPGGIYGPESVYYGKPGYGSGLGPRGIGDLGGDWTQSGAASAIVTGQPT